MKVGDRVLLAWNSANRDAQQFDDPDELNITRWWPNRTRRSYRGPPLRAGSTSAGSWPRSCSGQILERMPDYVVDVDALEPYPHQDQHRLPANPGDLHTRASAADRRGRTAVAY